MGGDSRTAITDPQKQGADRPAGSASPNLRAAHTANYPALLRGLCASLLVTTYQAGKLVMVRDEGDHLNTHFRTFQAPMGLALQAIGWPSARRFRSGNTWTSRRSRPSLVPPGRHDACFLPRSCHVTGNIQIHEMAWGSGEEFWVVNTRFSCLCTLDRSASFTPRWRPPFVTALEPTDRCHLNGLGMVDGRPRYVTALGQTDSPGGWRPDKAQGRHRDGRCQRRGDGRRAIDAALAAMACRAALGLRIGRGNPRDSSTREAAGTRRSRPRPGFTRGLDFAGNLAFVGLSQVRETAVFSGIPITERLRPEERTCGVCVVDLARGEPVALLRFEEGVQEVFAVQLLPGRQYPELVNDDAKLLENSFVVPDAALADVPAALQAGADQAMATTVPPEDQLEKT